MNTQTVEALKELLRTFVLGLIPVLILTLGVVVSGIDTEAGTFNIAWPVALAVFLAGAITVIQTSVMSALDKFMHKHNIDMPQDFKSLDSLKK